MPYEFSEWEQEPEPQASFSRSGSPPRKHAGIGFLDPPGPPTKQPAAKRMTIIGYALAAAGIVLYTQLDRIGNWRMGVNVLNAAALCSMAATFGGFLTAIVGSAIWARRSSKHEPLKIAFLVGVGSLFLLLLVGVNIHGPSAILMFLVPFSVVNFLSVLVVTRW